MRKAILVLAFLALSGNAIGQSLCTDAQGRLVPCNPPVWVIPDIGPRCLSCPNLEFIEDWFYKKIFFKGARQFLNKSVATKKEEFNGNQIKAVNRQ